jgi:hypothetical protein
MNYLSCWRSKKALASIRCLTINIRANRVAIVYSVITRLFLTLCKCWAVTFQPMQIKTLMIHSVLWIMLVASYCCVLLLLLFNLSFIFCSTFCSVPHSMRLFCSIWFYCSVFMFTSKYLVLILDCIQGISIPFNIIIKQVNKHHTANCTVFVLV